MMGIGLPFTGKGNRSEVVFAIGSIRIETVILLTVGLAVAVFMVGFGIYQIRSKEPVGWFARCEKRDSKLEARFQEWRKTHGVLWIVSGALLAAAYLAGAASSNSTFSMAAVCIGTCIPFPLMIWHQRQLKKLHRDGE